MPSYVGITFHFKMKAAQCYVGLLTITTRSWKKLSAILKLPTNEFSVLLDECPSVIDVLCLIKDLKHLLTVWCPSEKGDF